MHYHTIIIIIIINIIFNQQTRVTQKAGPANVLPRMVQETVNSGDLLWLSTGRATVSCICIHTPSICPVTVLPLTEYGSCWYVNCLVFPHTGELITVLVGMSIVLYSTYQWTDYGPCRYVNCLVFPHTCELITVLVGMSIVLYSTYQRTVCGSCRYVNCLIFPHTGELFAVLVGMSIVLYFHIPANWLRFL